MKGGENMLRKITVFALSLCMITVLALPVLVSAALDLGVNAAVNTGLGTKDLKESVVGIINIALGLLGLVAVIVVLIGGFEWMTAGGNEEKTGEAKKRLVAGVIGLAIILSAYAIAKFAINSLVTASGAT